MLTFSYDGTFPGLLTAIFDAYYRKGKPDRILADTSLQQNLFEQVIFITTNHEKADRVYRSIKEKISRQALENIFYTFLSEKKEAGTWIYQYLQLGWKLGKIVDRHLADDRVWKIHDLHRKVNGERHRILGLVRFRLLNHTQNIFYAPYAPDYNITGLVAPHFAQRLADQNWIIHDSKRQLAAIYNRKEWAITDLALNQIPPLATEEMAYQDLWKKYYHSIAITGRFNPKLQKKNMPMKYWRWLVEDPNKVYHW